MHDDADLICECVEEYCEDGGVAWWKLFLLGWLLFT